MNIKGDSGVVVLMVFPNSAAQTAGVRPNDVITKVNDKDIRDPDQLREVIQQMGPNSDVTVQVSRNGENQSLKAKLTEQNMNNMGGMNSRRFPMGDNEAMMNPFDRIRELENRIQELERRLAQAEQKK